MKKFYLSLLTVVMLYCITTAQMEGDQRIVGYWSNNNSGYSIMAFNFINKKLEIVHKPDYKFYFLDTGSTICSKDGEPLLWTNGMQIMDKNGKFAEDTIAYDGNGNFWKNWAPHGHIPFGFPIPDGAIILPVPDKPLEFSVIYPYSESHPLFFYAVTQLLEARILQNLDGTFVSLYKDKLIGPRVEWYNGTISAVRHANGRDWWIVTFREDSPEYYMYLLDPLGLKLDHIGEVDIPVLVGLGQSTFSSKGNYFARMDALGSANGENITLYKFDRCIGDLERLETFNESSGAFTGVAFSPSEQFLYADNNYELWQWDLFAEDIALSKILVDSFDGFVHPGWVPMIFGKLNSAPDGRIYMTPYAGGSSKYLNVIERPDSRSPDCNFLQHSIALPFWNAGISPNIPDFRLGPLDDSFCDTVGINNLPISRWRSERDDPADQFFIRFTDLSFYEPTTWHWDFDDGETSDVPSPLHLFEPGLYHVCLTVSNEYASDSSCQWIEIFPTDILEDFNRTLPDLSIIPNPFNEYLQIQSRSGDFRNAHIQLYDLFGRLVFDHQDLLIPSRIYMPKFPSGMYLCKIKDENGLEVSVKLVKE